MFASQETKATYFTIVIIIKLKEVHFVVIIIGNILISFQGLRVKAFSEMCYEVTISRVS